MPSRSIPCICLVSGSGGGEVLPNPPRYRPHVLDADISPPDLHPLKSEPLPQMQTPCMQTPFLSQWTQSPPSVNDACCEANHLSPHEQNNIQV